MSAGRASEGERRGEHTRKLTPKEYRRASELFDEVRKLPAGELKAQLRRSCAGNARLLEEVQSLLRHHLQGQGFLECGDGQPDGRHRAEPGDGDSGDELTVEILGFPGPYPEQIGPYRILDELGEGGMGTVYLAEQKEPIHRRVALKVIKLGMDTREVVARFEAERQALALMSHPGIAKIHDAGATPDGRPYFVMEYVRGEPITEYCDRNRLSTADRLDLFSQVCEAIQHAHHKGIIHRDIKPSNILVALIDGKPVPKVIDFGVAKATDVRLTEKTVYTKLRQMIGTPAYMSPEQAEMSGVDVDTRTDVYSLGVLLYELLTGTTPFDPETLLRRGYGELQRVIREEDPERPSTRLSSMEEETRATVARSRAVDARELTRVLRTDLDWIVMRALEKDRTRRYETPASFARDIERYLRDEPVEAGPPSRLYQWGKFIRRNRVGVAVSGVVLLSLLTGLGIATLGFWKAAEDRDVAEAAKGEAQRESERARAAEGREREAREKAEEKRKEAEASARKAEREAEKSRQLVELMRSMFRSASPHQVKGPEYTVRELLEDFSRRLQGRLEMDPEVEMRLQETIGEAHRGLGSFPEAEVHLARALELARQLGLSEDQRTLRLREVLAMVRGEQGHFDESEPTYLEVLEKLNRTLGEDHSETQRVRTNLAALYGECKRYDDAERLYKEALEIHRKNPAEEGWDSMYTALTGLAYVYQAQKKYAAAEPLHMQALEIQRRTLGEEHPHTLITRHILACLYRDREQYASAEAQYKDVLAIQERVLPEGHPDTLKTLDNLAGMYWMQKRYADAEVYFRKALDILIGKHGEEDLRTARQSCNLAGSQAAGGKLEEAERLAVKALETSRRLGGERHAVTLKAKMTLGSVRQEQERLHEAEQLYLEVLRVRREQLGETHPDTLQTECELTELYFGHDMEAKAAPLLEKLLVFYERELGEEHPRTMTTRGNLGVVYHKLGRYADAVPLYAKMLETMDRRAGRDNAQTIKVLYLLVHAHRTEGQLERALPLSADLLERSRRAFPADDPRVVAALIEQGSILIGQQKYLEAEARFAEILRLQERTLGETAPDTITTLKHLAALSAKQDHPERAEGFLVKLVTRRRASLGPKHPDTLEGLLALTGCLGVQKKYAKAEPLLLKAHALIVESAASDSLEQSAVRDLVQLYTDWGKPQEAARWRARLKEATPSGG